MEYTSEEGINITDVTWRTVLSVGISHTDTTRTISNYQTIFHR